MRSSTRTELPAGGPTASRARGLGAALVGAVLVTLTGGGAGIIPEGTPAEPPRAAAAGATADSTAAQRASARDAPQGTQGTVPEDGGVEAPVGSREGATGLLARVPQRAASGLKLGLLVAMTSVGLSLIFGTTRLINFAHGEMVSFGAIVAWYLNTTGPEVHIVYAGLLALVAGGLLGAGLDLGLWRPLRLRQAGIIQMLVISVGLALVIRHVLLFFYGGSSNPYTDYALQEAVRLGPVAMTPRDLVVMGLSVVILVAVGLALAKTRIGKAMRAVADNRDLAESSGINVQRIILVIWVAGGALTALGGVFLGLVETVNYFMGFHLLVLMFAGVILGGLGTAFGAMVGSLIVGMVVELSTLFFSPELKEMWALAVLILILLVRPRGILGVSERVG